MKGMMIDRRGFVAGVGAVALARPAAASPSVRGLYDRSIVIDALASPSSWNIPLPPPGPLTAEQLANVKASGITAINLTVGKPSGFEPTVREIAFWLDQIERHPTHFRLVKTHADIAAAKASGQMAVIFGFQGLESLGGDISLIDTFARFWVKIMQITYNGRNPFGSGSSLPDSEGLTELGRQAVARINALNIVVDASHANPRTALDVAAASSKPIAITHAGCRAVFNHQRNQPDEVIRAVARRGGVVGIYLMPFLGQDPVSPSRATLLRHITHALKVCGEDHVGIGSDQSVTPVAITPEYMAFVRKTAEARQKAGIGAPGEADGPIAVPEVNSARRIEMIAADLAKAGYPNRVAEKVIGGNFNRLFRDIWQG